MKNRTDAPRRNTLKDQILDLPVETIEIWGSTVESRLLDVKEMLPMLEAARDSSLEKWFQLPRDTAVVDKGLLAELSKTLVDDRPLVSGKNEEYTLWIPQDNISCPIKIGDRLMWLDSDTPNGPYVYRNNQDPAKVTIAFAREFAEAAQGEVPQHEGFTRVDSTEEPFTVVLRVDTEIGPLVLANNNWGDGPQQPLSTGDIVRFKANGPSHDFYGISKAEHANYGLATDQDVLAIDQDVSDDVTTDRRDHMSTLLK
ncbi:hypothetical protein HOG48_05895 [Candidatus Peregrinibacteria bacterium]|jgi:hypothetical protein|nr:hypothetical protein [Candidatus Peregrinibacteria bacterium]